MIALVALFLLFWELSVLSHCESSKLNHRLPSNFAASDRPAAMAVPNQVGLTAPIGGFLGILRLALSALSGHLDRHGSIVNKRACVPGRRQTGEVFCARLSIDVFKIRMKFAINGKGRDAIRKAPLSSPCFSFLFRFLLHLSPSSFSPYRRSGGQKKRWPPQKASQSVRHAVWAARRRPPPGSGSAYVLPHARPMQATLRVVLPAIGRVFSAVSIYQRVWPKVVSPSSLFLRLPSSAHCIPASSISDVDRPH